MTKSSSHPCVFAGEFVRDQVDPRVQADWTRRFGRGAPFGRLRQLFRQQHCSSINPYDSRTCPYREEDCALAFLQCVEKTVQSARDARSATGYFRSVARTLGTIRADEKPLARDHEPQAEDRPGHAGNADDGDDEGSRLRRARALPTSIGALLGALDLGSRQGSTHDGQAGPKR